jgi:hypothetical protein
MGPWVYYSPLMVGMLFVLALSGSLRAAWPTLSTGAFSTFLIALAIAGGIVAQLLMVGLQGVRAQVLPVPFGRSIRGRSAVSAGYLILLTKILLIVALLLASESLTTAAWILLILGCGSGIGAILIYIWSLPVATPDFRDERQ